MVRLGSQILEDAKNFQVCKMCKGKVPRFSATDGYDYISPHTYNFRPPTEIKLSTNG